MTVRIGFTYRLLHEQFPVPKLVDLGVAAEQAGFDELWASDHFHPWQDNQGHAGQAWITLTALGQHTRSIPFGTGVTCPSFRYRPQSSPRRLRRSPCFSPGRVFLGLGSGEAVNEVPAGGGWDDRVDVSSVWQKRPGSSVSCGAATGSRIVAAITRSKTRAFTIHHLFPVPIYVAASGRRTARAAGELGDGWINLGEGLGRPEIREAFREGVRSAGKAPDQLRILIGADVIVGRTRQAEEADRVWRSMRFGAENFLDQVNVVTVVDHGAVKRQVPRLRRDANPRPE